MNHLTPSSLSDRPVTVRTEPKWSTARTVPARLKEMSATARAQLRRALVEAKGGGDLSRRALIEAMVRSEEEWQAVADFCEAVMLAKEEADCIRQRRSRRRHRDSDPDFRPPQARA